MESVTTASITQRDIGVRGANRAITETEGNPCLLQRSANLAPASQWVQPMQHSAGAGDATPRRDSATASQVWRAPTVIDVSWATGALEKMAAVLVTVPETATNILETVSIAMTMSHSLISPLGDESLTLCKHQLMRVKMSGNGMTTSRDFLL